MRTLMLSLGALSLAVPAAVALPAGKAEAQTYKKHHKQRKQYRYREWRGRDGRMYCRKSDGTTGLVIGAAAGALAGRAIDTHGERTTGTVLGAVVGGLVGRDIDRKKHCR